jgi:hypothetical protein
MGLRRYWRCRCLYFVTSWCDVRYHTQIYHDHSRINHDRKGEWSMSRSFWWQGKIWSMGNIKHTQFVKQETLRPLGRMNKKSIIWCVLSVDENWEFCLLTLYTQNSCPKKNKNGMSCERASSLGFFLLDRSVSNQSMALQEQYINHIPTKSLLMRYISMDCTKSTVSGSVIC